MSLNFSGYNVPVHTQGALERYIVNGYEPGGFLLAVLSNDRVGAMSRADYENRYALFDICNWIYNCAPRACHGSMEKVYAYIDATRKAA